MKSYKSLIYIILYFTTPLLVNAQKVSGIVHGSGNQEPLPGANVLWEGTTSGTVTDQNGLFHLDYLKGKSKNLIISYIGFESDTVLVDNPSKFLEINLKESISLDEVVIAERSPGAHISRTDPILTQNITIGELQKAACCNLSESFETNASVDISYSDAISGAKHIKLLGLSGKYSQLQFENLPYLRGLATSYGLSYVPGTWMESIQVSKGTASVKNGYESITGQINIEYKKPDNSDKLFLNFYANHFGDLEGNFDAAIRLSDRWSTGILGHAEYMGTKEDMNGDSFLDMPLITQYNFLNRWKYEVPGEICQQFGFRYLYENRSGGQMSFDHDDKEGTDEYYGTEISTRRFEAFNKTGFLFNRPSTSLALMNSLSYHDLNSFFGLRDYVATEWNFYNNLVFESYLKNTSHKYSTGLSWMYNRIDENLEDSPYSRIESVPGAFVEYTYIQPEKITLLLGMRVDHHNKYGFFYTPRIHLKYAFTHHTIARLSAGKGYRSANVIAENLSYLASSRQIVYCEGLKMENAWNYGINVTHYVDVLGKEMTINAEFWRTDFINQVIVDQDENIGYFYIYNLNGRSYSNSTQVEVNYEIIQGLTAVAAFRFNDVKMTTGEVLQDEVFVNKYKGLLTLSFQTSPKKWQFDFTTQLNGKSRLPNTSENPEAYRRGNESPVYTILNAQITKFFKRWDIYLGGENLTNFMQMDPIIAADDPFGSYFDASQIWGPVYGVKIYAGVRYAVK